MGNIIFIKKHRIAPDKVPSKMAYNNGLFIKIPVQNNEEYAPTVFLDDNFSKEYAKYNVLISTKNIDKLLQEYKQFVTKLFEPNYLQQNTFYILTAEIYNKKSEYIATFNALRNNISAYDNSNTNTKKYQDTLDSITSEFNSNISLLRNVGKLKCDNILFSHHSFIELLNKK
jgi:hypothetical protein